MFKGAVIRTEVVSLCLNHKFYNRGSNFSFRHMLDSLCDDELTDVELLNLQIAEIADNIKSHSLTTATADYIKFLILNNCVCWIPCDDE